MGEKGNKFGFLVNLSLASAALMATLPTTTHAAESKIVISQPSVPANAVIAPATTDNDATQPCDHYSHSSHSSHSSHYSSSQ